MHVLFAFVVIMAFEFVPDLFLYKLGIEGALVFAAVLYVYYITSLMSLNTGSLVFLAHFKFVIISAVHMHRPGCTYLITFSGWCHTFDTYRYNLIQAQIKSTRVASISKIVYINKYFVFFVGTFLTCDVIAMQLTEEYSENIKAAYCLNCAKYLSLLTDLDTHKLSNLKKYRIPFVISLALSERNLVGTFQELSDYSKTI